MALPKTLQVFLPSSKVTDLDPQIDKKYILQNLLKNADINAWRWMWKSYTLEDIMDVIRHSRILEKRDKAIWENYYKLNSVK